MCSTETNEILQDMRYNLAVLYADVATIFAWRDVITFRPALPVMHDNRVYTPDGTASESGKSIAAWQAQGHDLGTTVQTTPTDAELIAMAKELLQM